jgi:hypothetical protein
MTMSTCSHTLHAVDRRRAGVAARGTDDRDPFAPLREHVVEQAAHELQGDVLERERRAVEQLEHEVVVVDLHERHGGRVAERGVRLLAQASRPSRGRGRERRTVRSRPRRAGRRSSSARSSMSGKRRPLAFGT